MENIKELLQKSQAYLNEKKYEKSLEFSLMAIETDHTDPKGHLLAGLSCYALNNPQLAVFHFETAGEKIKAFESVWVQYAMALSLLPGRAQDAITQFKGVINAYPPNPVTLLNLGYCLLCNNHYSEALIYLDKAEQCGEHSFKLHFYRGICYYNLKNYIIAVMHLDSALEMEPGNDQAAFLAGEASRVLYRFEEAVEYYSRAYFYNPQHTQALNQRLIARLQLKDENGMLLNREAAQADVDLLMKTPDGFLSVKDKDGTPLQVRNIEISETGNIDVKVDKNDKDITP